MRPLTPFFSFSASSPLAYTYDAANPSAAWAYGYLYSYGGLTGPYPPYRLGDQSANDEILVGYDPVDPTDQTITNTLTDVWGRSCIQIQFAGVNVSTENQYLLLFALRGLSGSPTAQFFVNGTLVDTEALAGDEHVAVLLDCPGPNIYTTVYVRLASASYWARMGFKGMDCYLL